MTLTKRQKEVIESMECSGTMAQRYIPDGIWFIVASVAGLEHVSSRLLCHLHSKGLFRKIGKSKDWEYYWLSNHAIKIFGDR
jgi:hypothetical protein